MIKGYRNVLNEDYDCDEREALGIVAIRDSCERLERYLQPRILRSNVIQRDKVRRAKGNYEGIHKGRDKIHHLRCVVRPVSLSWDEQETSKWVSQSIQHVMRRWTICEVWLSPASEDICKILTTSSW